MRIVLAHSRYRSGAPSGENQVIAQEAELLRAAGHEVALFERSSDEIAEWSLARRAALPVTSVRSPGVARELREELARWRPDLVHVHNTFPMLSASVLTACQEMQVPVVATLHNYKLLCASGDFFRDGSICHRCVDGSVAPALRHRCYRGSLLATGPVVAGALVNRRLWRELVSAYIFISASQRDLMADLGLPTERVFVKHNFVPPFPVEPRRSRHHAVAYCGRLDEAKGVRLLQAAWERFCSRNPQSRLRLMIAGGGPLEGEVAAWAAGRPDVELCGQLPRTKVGSLLAGVLAVVVPSAWEETFGLVAVEAMSVGVAPVVPGRGSFPELVTPGVDGAVVPPGDPEALARCFERVDSDPTSFIELGHRALRTYRDRFHPDHALSGLLDVYRFATTHPVGASWAPA